MFSLVVIPALVLTAATAWLVRRHTTDSLEPPVGLVEAGAALYATHCASCHGGHLEGRLGWRDPLPDGGYPAPPHDASGHTWHHPDSQLFEITKLGGAATSPAGFDSRMPAFGEVLSDADIWAVLHFIKSRWPAKQREHQERVTRESQRTSAQRAVDPLGKE